MGSHIDVIMGHSRTSTLVLSIAWCLNWLRHPADWPQESLKRHGRKHRSHSMRRSARRSARERCEVSMSQDSTMGWEGDWWGVDGLLGRACSYRGRGCSCERWDEITEDIDKGHLSFNSLKWLWCQSQMRGSLVWTDSYSLCDHIELHIGVGEANVRLGFTWFVVQR